MTEILPHLKATTKGQSKGGQAQQRKATAETKHAKNKNKKHSYLYQRLGNEMIGRLLDMMGSSPSLLDLLGRLTIAQRSATLSSSTLVNSNPNSNLILFNQSQYTVHPHGISPTCIGNRTYTSLHPKGEERGNIFTLDDLADLAALQSLAETYGRVSHMGILDKSYSFFLSSSRDAALSFKVENKVTVISGDPLCHPSQFSAILEEFKEYRKKNGLGIAFLGASDRLASYGRKKKWVTMHFGEERVLNPMTNPVLLETAGKRIVRQNRQLLDPNKGKITVKVYSTAAGVDPIMQEYLVRIYETWREERNQQRKGKLQAFITVYDPFALPGLMVYIYTEGQDGLPNGFAALRKLGATTGYHIDPCIAVPGAPRGLTDLLIFAAMSLLNRAGVSYLSLGYEPMLNIGEISGMPKLLSRLTRAAYRRTFRALPVGGKTGYHDKFRPDKSQQSGLHMVFPDGIPSLSHSAAIMHVANIKRFKPSTATAVQRRLHQALRWYEAAKQLGWGMLCLMPHDIITNSGAVDDWLGSEGISGGSISAKATLLIEANARAPVTQAEDMEDSEMEDGKDGDEDDVERACAMSRWARVLFF
ncbi:Aspartate-tRNA ligase, cytoplasmic 1 [Paraphaeosphaeria sporulosa]